MATQLQGEMAALRQALDASLDGLLRKADNPGSVLDRIRDELAQLTRAFETKSPETTVPGTLRSQLLAVVQPADEQLLDALLQDALRDLLRRHAPETPDPEAEASPKR